MATPVTTPVDEFTVAPAGLPLLQVPPILPLVLKLMVEPTHTVEGPLMVPALRTGLTVTVNVVAGPVQPFTVAVTFTVATSGLLVLFVAVYAPIFPLPLRPKPTFTELVQLNVMVPPVVGLLNEIADAGTLLQ